MFSTKVRAVLTTMDKSKLVTSVRRPPQKIGVIFFVAIAIRKFQKFESDKYKKSLEYNFDRRAALDELRRIYAANETFSVEHFVKLANFIRKFNLTFEDLDSLDGESGGDKIATIMCKHLTDSLSCRDAPAHQQRQQLLFLCLSLKYLTQNSCDKTNPLTISSIVQLIKTCSIPQLKETLVELLLARFEKFNSVLTKDQSSKLKTFVLSLPELNDDSKSFILRKLQSGNDVASKHTTEENGISGRPIEVCKVKKNQQAVSKTIQTVKSKQESKKSEEADFNFLNLSDSMKNRNRRLNCNTVLETFEPTKNEDGSDRSMWRNTWQETTSLCSLASNGHVLKDDDKDNYLPDKFLGTHYFPCISFDGKARKMYSFFINQMCSSIFWKISKRQQLNDKAIDKLLKCVTNFESLVSVLDLNKDFVTFFVDQIFERYWDLKGLTSPDIVVKFVKEEIMRKTTEEYLEKGWFYNTTKVKKIPYDQTNVEKIIRTEINRVRLDAIEALYNCAIRDKKGVLTVKRVKKIQACAKMTDSLPDQKFKGFIFKLIELAETLDDFDYAETFENYLDLLNPQSTENVTPILRFIGNQAKDMHRSKELFSNDKIAKLIELTGPYSCFSIEQKLNIVEIINTYLEHEHNASLSEENLSELLSHTFELNHFTLMKSALTSLLLSTDKTRSMSKSILDWLPTTFDILSTNEECTSFVVFILSRIFCAEDESEQCFLDNQEVLELISTKMLCDHIVQLNDDDGERVKFDNPSENNSNSSSNQIDLLAAKIILRSVENKIILSSATIENLLLLLHSNKNNKQTLIMASKCLYGLSKYMSFKSDDLCQLLDMINSPIYDVSVFLQTAYLKGCVQVSYASCLDSIHLENISSLYAPESLKLGQNDYEGEINKNLFKTLLYESRKQEFKDNDIFLLFNSILNLNKKYALQVLEILVSYTNKYIVPEATVRTLENLLGISNYFEKALLILQNVILSGMLSVTRKTLTIFINYLCSSSNSRQRFYSFKLLEHASQNQELPYETFQKFELARAGYALEWSATDKNDVIEFIQTLTDKGMQLPVDTRLALEKEINHVGTLNIFANASRNKQIINQHLLESMIKLFDPKNANNKNINTLLITIFENASKNNQTLPRYLVDKLEQALHNNDLEQSVLPVFIYLAQKGEKLSHQVNNKLLDMLTSEQDPILRQELLSSLSSLIDANQTEIKLYLSKVNQILIKEIASYNSNIQKLCITTICKLVMISKQIDKQLLEKLVEIGTDIQCNKTIRKEVQVLFESIEDHHNPLILKNHYREKIQLSNLNCYLPRVFLDQLHCYLRLDEELLLQNYKQLKNIIDNKTTGLQEEALNVLHKYRHKSKITDELFESIASLYQSTNSESLKKLCLELFTGAVESGKTLVGRAHEVWSAKLKQEESIQKFFQSKVCKEIMQEFQLSNNAIVDLLQLIQGGLHISSVDELADLVELIVKDKSNYYESQIFVQLIEQCLLKKKILEITLPCYCQIIKEKKYCNVEECLQVMVQHVSENEQDLENLKTSLFECMYFANKLTQLPEVCLQFVVNNLDNSSGVIRGYSFGIMRTSKHEECSIILSDWCDAILKNLAENMNVEITKTQDYLDLLEVIVSLQYLDVTVFIKNKRDVWKRELQVSSIFERFKAFQLDQIQFYTCWFMVEEKFKYHKSCEILSFIKNFDFDNFSQIVELTMMIHELSFEDVILMLSTYGPEPYEAFKQDWCTRKIQACCASIKDGINTKYAKKLAEKLCSSFDFITTRKLFSCLMSIDNLCTFQNIIQLCSREEIDLDTILSDKKIQLNELKHLIEAKYLFKCAKSKPETETEENSFLQIFQKLIDVGWNLVQLHELVTVFNPPRPFNQFQNLLHFLNTIQAYSLSPSSNLEKIKQILMDTMTFQDMIQKLNKIVIENHFQLEGKVKDLNELIAELEKANKPDCSLLEFIKTGSLDIRKNIFQIQSDKLSWNEKQIYNWAKKIKSSKQEFSNYEAIAVILRANFLITGHTFTDTQILCCLIALRSGGDLEKKKGKLLEVATGEGKSTIICILAIIEALRGKQVDIITSSPVLAERDAKQKAQLYRMFNLTCSDNNDQTVYLKGRKDCYLADIVYGEMSQFQFDILRDNYSKLGTLGGRRFTTAIVDEVDSMLIDDSSKIARLSSMVPGMDHFQTIYVFIWQHLNSIKQKLIMFNDKLYFINGKVSFEKGKITLEVADNNNDIVKIPDLENYLLEFGNNSEVCEFVGDDIDGFLRKSLESYLDCQLSENKIYIPKSLETFLKIQRPKWITNAIEALNYQENIHYVVQDGEIRPVDYYSTGIIQSSTNWSDGLHQFLQLKHNLKMTSETLTTNFLSNMGFMNKYNKVYGLTGTLGTDTARHILKDAYKVDLINIPQRRQKQYLELESVVAQGEASWLNEITSNIKLEIKKKRGILVICETIEHANRIERMLKNKLRSSSVKLYTMNDMNQEKNVEKIFPGEVIIATNLAGRGTDIQTEEIEVYGGLHVILTFMPGNQRVEDQAFGRTSRQGKRGTGLMILNAHNLVGFTGNTERMKIERDNHESKQLMEFKEKDLKLIQIKDKLFNTFCTFLNDEIRLTIRKKHHSLIKKMVNLFTEVLPTTYEISVLAAVEEEWAGFLSKLDEGMIKCENAEKECDALIDQLRSDFKLNKLIKNPYHYISIANDILVNGWAITNASKAKEAQEYFEKATSLEEEGKSKVKQNLSTLDEMQSEQNLVEDNNETVNYAGAAHVGLAWCSILLKEKDYKEKALSSFKTALKCLSNEMSLLNSIQLLLEQKQTGFVTSDLYKQLNVKSTILGSYLNGINDCINAIKRSKRLIDIVEFEKHKESDQSILETIKYFNDLERNEREMNEFKNTELKLCSGKSYSVTFNHLTRREDSGTIDQALITLNHAFDESNLKKTSYLKTKSQSRSLDKKSYDDIQINLRQVDLARIKNALFNPDIEFEDLTGESAIAKLKEQRSYWHKFFGTDYFFTDLKIHSNNDENLNQRYERIQINKIIEIIEERMSDPALRFNIAIKKANENEINKLFTTKNDSNRSVKLLRIHFDNLTQETALAKLSSIKARSFDVEFVLNKSDLLKLIETNNTLECGHLYINKKHHFEKVKREELVRRVRELKTDDSPCYIKFDKLRVDQAEKLVKSCPKEIPFTISFSEIQNFYDCNIYEGQANFSFEKLEQDTAKKVIDVLRKENFEFSIEFKNLSHEEVRFIIQHASLDQEHMEIKQLKNVHDLFMTGASHPVLELNEFVSKGIEYIIVMNEKLFVPWWSVSVVAALGIGQVIIGGALIATGFGSTVGMGLVTEGIADIFTAYRAYSSRQFQWSDYCKQKAVSLAISAMSMGYSKCKDGLQNATKGLKTITTGASNRALEEAGKQVITNKNVVGQTMMMTGSNLKSVAAKFICVKGAEAVAREGLNTGIQLLCNFSFGLLKPKICESVQSKVRSSFCNTELNGLLRKIYAIDLASNSHQLQSRVEQIVSETLNPQSDFLQKQWYSIGLPLVKGVLSDSSKFGSYSSMAVRIIGTLNGLHQVQTMTDTVAKTLVTKLKQLDRNSMTISLVFHRCLKIKKDNAKIIAKKLKILGIFDEFDNLNISQRDIMAEDNEIKTKINKFSDDWSKNSKVILQELGNNCSTSMKDDVDKCILFIKEFYGKFVEIDLNSFSMIMKSVSDQIASQLIRVMDSQLIQPWSTLAVSNLTDSISKRLQHHYLVDKSENSVSHNEDQSKFEELLKKENLSPKEKAFMASYGKFRTFSQQIEYNTKDYCIAYSQCEMIYNAGQHNSTNSSVDKNVKQVADGVRDGQPANIAEMFALAKLNQINLKVVDDKNYIKTKEDEENNVQVIYVESSPNNGIGHAYHMDSNGKFSEVRTEGNDCVYGVISKILENNGITKSITTLRDETAQHIESNSKNFSKVLAAENWIRKTHPDSSSKLLFTAGLYRDGNGRLKIEENDCERLSNAINSNEQARGGQFGGLFKRTVPKRLGKDDEREKTLHHIIPNSEVEQIVLDSYKENPGQFQNDLETYVNMPQIRDVVDKLLDDQGKLRQPERVGTFLHASISNNPNNFVRGPLPNSRANDPGNLKDTELLNEQSTNYQNVANQVKNFQTLTQLPPTEPVDWVKNTSDQKYKVVSGSGASNSNPTNSNP